MGPDHVGCIQQPLLAWSCCRASTSLPPVPQTWSWQPHHIPKGWRILQQLTAGPGCTHVLLRSPFATDALSKHINMKLSANPSTVVHPQSSMHDFTYLHYRHTALQAVQQLQETGTISMHCLYSTGRKTQLPEPLLYNLSLYKKGNRRIELYHLKAFIYTLGKQWQQETKWQSF